MTDMKRRWMLEAEFDAEEDDYEKVTTAIADLIMELPDASAFVITGHAVEGGA